MPDPYRAPRDIKVLPWLKINVHVRQYPNARARVLQPLPKALLLLGVMFLSAACG